MAQIVAFGGLRLCHWRDRCYGTASDLTHRLWAMGAPIAAAQVLMNETLFECFDGMSMKT
ncbi:hypothetical protein [Acidovorax soli]|uniref:hypothetical protein n=1 Tax=Acidovorax soli TaxID=592050 RepID=UPI00047A238B